MEVTILSIISNDDGNIDKTLLAFTDRNQAAEVLHKEYLDSKAGDINHYQPHWDTDDVNIIYEEPERDFYLCDSFMLYNEKYNELIVGELTTVVVQ